MGEAIALYRKGDFDGAISKYKQLLKERPKSPDAYAGLIRSYLKQKKLNQAASAAEEAVAAMDSPRIRVARAELLFRQGKIDEAELEWARAINSGPPEARAYLGLARVRNARAMYKSGKGMIEKARELDPNDPEIEELWVRTLSIEDQIRYFEDSLSKRSDWPSEKRQDIGAYVQYLKNKQKQSFQLCRLAAGPSTTEIPLTMILGEDAFWRGWGLDVYFNGRRNKLLIDTGASGIILSRKAAERVGVEKIADNAIGGIGDKGKRNGYVGFVGSVQVGNLQFEGCLVEILDSRSVMGNDGIIGTDFFEDFLVDLNFPSARLRLSPLPQRAGESTMIAGPGEERPQNSREQNNNPERSDQASSPKPIGAPFQDAYVAPEMETYTRVFRFGHDLLVPTAIGNVTGELFLLDTGAFDNSISPVAAREVTKISSDSNMGVKGLSGNVKSVFSANKVVLQFGHLRQENQNMIAFDTSSISDEDGTEVSGLLGFKLLRFLDIKIDYRDALVDFRYDPERWKNWRGR